MSISHGVAAAFFLSGMLVLSLLAPSDLAAADAWDAAKARHAWSWFAVSEAQAEAEARRQGGTLLVVERDGKMQPWPEKPPAGLVVSVQLQDGRVLWAQMRNGKTVHTEGVVEVALLPWLGLPEAEALAQVRAAGRAVRIVARDDEQFAVTLDFNTERLNLHVRKGVVVAITTG